MDYLIYAEDKPDSLHIRQAARADHIAWLKAPSEVSLLAAGPWLDADGEMRGSLVIVSALDQKTVEDWLARDPYKAAGLTAAVTVKPYNWVIGRPE
jgi:uncharacterized protein YciI